MKKIVAISSAIALSFAVLASGVSAQATPSTDPAPTMPSDNQLVGVDCGNTNAFYNIEADGSSAIANPVGDVIGSDSANSTECSGGVAYNPEDGYVYGVLYASDNNQMFPEATGGTSLVKIDPSTGIQTIVSQFTGDCTGGWLFTITPQAALVSSGMNLCTVNLETAETTLLGTVSGPISDYAMGYNPTDDTLYWSGNSHDLWSIDPDTLVGTQVLDFAPETGEYTCPAYGGTGRLVLDASFAFDSNGIGWAQSDTCQGFVVAFDVATSKYWYMGEVVAPTGGIVNTDSQTIYAEGAPFYIEGYAIVPATENSNNNGGNNNSPELAETGASGAANLPLFMAALIPIGALALALNRRRAKQN